MAQMVKASVCNVGDLGSIPGWGRSSGEGNGNPLQYSCLENSIDGGAGWTIVPGVPMRFLHLWNFPGKSTGVGCHFLLQGIFPTQGLDLGLLHCK